MPGYDGRGPWFGGGPGAGWGMGLCGAGYRGWRGSRRGAGFGRGFGFGRGWVWNAAPFAGSYPAMDPADEKQALQEERSALEAEMKATKDRLDSMEKGA